jgi:DNA-binding NarL/FixJ family response regulator
VVVLTILDYPAAGEKAIQAGADEFIEKGASVAEIFQTIHVAGPSSPKTVAQDDGSK